MDSGEGTSTDLSNNKELSIPLILLPLKRGRGRRPQNEEALITAALKEGVVMFRRGIFRRFNKYLKADEELH